MSDWLSNILLAPGISLGSSGSLSDLLKAYLCSFSTGDLHVLMHGRQVRIEASTTHPAQISLVSSLFGPYGRRIMYPMKTKNAFGWRIVYDLGPRFLFLLDSRTRTYAALRMNRTFYFALAGLIDSEGHIGIGAQGHSYAPLVRISNSDLYLVLLILRSLVERGYRGSIQTRTYPDGTHCHDVSLSGKSAIRLLKRLRLRHPEKIEARQIALAYESSPYQARTNYLSFRQRIRLERDACIEEARTTYDRRDEKRLTRRADYDVMLGRAVQMWSDGETIPRIGTTLGRSQRTIYRLLRRNRVGNGKPCEG